MGGWRALGGGSRPWERVRECCGGARGRWREEGCVCGGGGGGWRWEGIDGADGWTDEWMDGMGEELLWWEMCGEAAEQQRGRRERVESLVCLHSVLLNPFASASSPSTLYCSHRVRPLTLVVGYSFFSFLFSFSSFPSFPIP